jgi:hypothetical protein
MNPADRIRAGVLAGSDEITPGLTIGSGKIGFTVHRR